MGKLHFYCVNQQMRLYFLICSLTGNESGGLMVYLCLQTKHRFSPWAFIAMVPGPPYADMSPESYCHSVWCHWILWRHSVTDLMLRTHQWLRTLCTTSFPFSGKLTQDVFTGENHQNVSPAVSEELASSLCPASPGKSMKCGDSSLFKNPIAYGLDVLWLTRYWKLPATRCRITIQHPGCQSICCLAPFPCSGEGKSVCIFSCREDGKGWGICLRFQLAPFLHFMLCHPTSLLSTICLYI